MRKFEYVTRLTEANFSLPKRSTKTSAGYDFFCPEEVNIAPYKTGDKPCLIRTGVKAKMEDDEVLLLYNRSSNPGKKNLVIPNGVGVIDSDYYGNLDNDGEIGFTFYNLGSESITIKQGEKLGQGIFQKYLLTENDEAEGDRLGGFGSTDNK